MNGWGRESSQGSANVKPAGLFFCATHGRQELLSGLRSCACPPSLDIMRRKMTELFSRKTLFRAFRLLLIGWFPAFLPGVSAWAGEQADPGWAFQPARDEFRADALLDLRNLNERTAGEHGFIARSKNGSDFAFADGTPTRFWAVNDGAFDKDLAWHARFLAKRGINMVRFHCNITPTNDDLMSIDQGDRDRLWKGVAAMKKEGIYATYSPYWAGPARVKPPMGILDTGGSGNWGLLFFDHKLQEAYKHWLKQVLTEKNPYTGLSLARDPALAIIEIQNEDSLLFWTTQGIKGSAKQELRRQFARFLLQEVRLIGTSRENLERRRAFARPGRAG